MIHLYHGDGKGKTTAAMGLALRALGAGRRVTIVQFLKGSASGEIEMLQKLPGVAVLRGKNSDKFSFRMDAEERERARRAHNENLEAAMRRLQEGQCDFLVLDEALGALSAGLLEEETLRRLVDGLPGQAELVLTGRGPGAWLREAADYCTEMKCEKHPYQKGVAARKGVEF